MPRAYGLDPWQAYLVMARAAALAREEHQHLALALHVAQLLLAARRRELRLREHFERVPPLWQQP